MMITNAFVESLNISRDEKNAINRKCRLFENQIRNLHKGYIKARYDYCEENEAILSKCIRENRLFTPAEKLRVETIYRAYLHLFGQYHILKCNYRDYLERIKCIFADEYVEAM